MENKATPARLQVPREVTSSAFRNVSYQRATHESMMADSVVNQSSDVASAGQVTAAVTSAAETARPTAGHSQVHLQLPYVPG